MVRGAGILSFAFPLLALSTPTTTAWVALSPTRRAATEFRRIGEVRGGSSRADFLASFPASAAAAAVAVAAAAQVAGTPAAARADDSTVVLNRQLLEKGVNPFNSACMGFGW